MGSFYSASVAIGWRPRKQVTEMVARITVVVFTIIVAVWGVSIPDSEKELREKDTQKNNVKRSDGSVNLMETENYQTRLEREAKKEPRKKKKSSQEKKKKDRKQNRNKSTRSKTKKGQKQSKTKKNKTGKKTRRKGSKNKK